MALLRCPLLLLVLYLYALPLMVPLSGVVCAGSADDCVVAAARDIDNAGGR